MTGGSRTAEAEKVERANTDFYEAIEQGDLDAMEKVWLGDEQAGSVSVVHPGMQALRGRAEVLRSYALIMANTEYIQFFLTDVEVDIAGDAAVVTCTENILSGGPAPADGTTGPLIGGLVVATNVFRRVADGWKLWSHHGSPVMVRSAGDGAPGHG